jgi:hypothetical protein
MNTNKDYLKLGINNIDCLKLGATNILSFILTHPFDTFKVDIQTNFKYITKYSMKNIYNGFVPGLIGYNLEKLVAFKTYNYCIKQDLNVPLSGALSGLFTSLITTPCERIKILQQTNQRINHISINNLFTGLSATAYRDTLGYTVYFSTYQILKQDFLETYNTPKLPLLFSFIYGGISGVLSCLITYHYDKYKTIVQTNNISNYKKFLTNNNSGLIFGLSRAYLLHCGIFSTMEYFDILEN